MAELKYVDWDGLVYYDGKIKQYIQDRDENYVKMGGIMSFDKLPDPTYYNLHYIYKITDKFTTNSRFDTPGLVCQAGTWVQCVDLHEDASKYRYIIFNEETIGGTADIDLSDYYTKSEVEAKIDEAIQSIDIPEIQLEDYYTKQEVDNLIPDTDAFLTSEDVEKTLEDFATVDELNVLKEGVADVQELVEEKADKSDLEGLASEEFVLRKIEESKEDTDLSNYYTKSETDAKIEEAIENIIIVPDFSDLATKEDLAEVESKIPSIEGLATKQELEDAINSIEHPTVDLEGYATEEYVAEKVAEIKIPTKVSELENDTGFLTEHQDLSEYAKKSDIPQPELFVIDYNSPNFADAFDAYKAGKLLLLTNAAPDIDSYAIMNYVRSDLITFTKFLMSRSSAYGAFNTYYLHSDNTWEVAKEVKLNKVEAKVDDNNTISELVIGKDTYEFDNFATTENITQLTQDIENIENTYVTNETLQNNYVSNTYITENYTTNEQLEATYVTNEKVTEVVTQEVNTVVTEQIETKVTEVIQEKVDAGEITVTTDKISYGDFEEDI